ncbi:MAG: VOC family protein [Cellvibrionaceae bacterium]
MADTRGINHLGLAVKNLEETKSFFVDGLGWKESGYDASYPRVAVSDGHVRLTLWQVDYSTLITEFNRKQNIGLHHLALEVESEAQLNAIYQKLNDLVDVTIEFSPESVGDGPRKHMMCLEPGGIRIEFIWPGAS